MLLRGRFRARALARALALDNAACCRRPQNKRLLVVGDVACNEIPLQKNRRKRKSETVIVRTSSLRDGEVVIMKKTATLQFLDLVGWAWDSIYRALIRAAGSDGRCRP
jgi:hypothetical protein